jgi:membrane protein YqaA with SNARE-associated domain
VFDIFLDWRPWVVILVLATLTLFSSVAKYRLGEAGLATVKSHFPQVSEERWERIGGYFERWGSPVVFLSFLPLAAWIIPPAAGAYGIGFRAFLFWAFVAKVVRYCLLLLILSGGFNLIF